MPVSTYTVREIRDVRIPTSDQGVTLAANLFLPEGSGPFPALVQLLPYRKDAGAGLQHDGCLRWFAARGFATLLVDFRGTGSSDGEQRPPFDAAEADDGVAAIEWAGTQPWSSGKVGMWGLSYGAALAMRTAARRPPRLKAILPIMGFTDPEIDVVHPDGSQGCLASLMFWATHMLCNQLVPPLHGYDTPAEKRRWQQRLHRTEPWLLDLWRHGPGDPVWRSRIIDPSDIVVPSFCVTGWRDLICDAQLRAYEHINAPKKLLVGPWLHTLPQDSPFEAVDFRLIALRWWNHWLNGIDNGIMEEPAVTLYVQGGASQWREFRSWPPTHATLGFTAGEDATLVPSDDDTGKTCKHADNRSIARMKSDPTAGPLSGLHFFPGAFGLPLDQRDDDLRTTPFESRQMANAVVIAGRPSVTVRWARSSAPARLVVRLTDVDSDGRSILISSGTVVNPRSAQVHDITLGPTCYAVPAAHRLRVTLSDSDFPRLWPAQTEVTAGLEIQSVELRLPVLSHDEGTRIELPRADESNDGSEPLAMHRRPHWTITRDHVVDGVEVCVGQQLTTLTPNRDHLFDRDDQVSAKIARAVPSGAQAKGSSVVTAKMKGGEVITVKVATQMTSMTMGADAVVSIDGNTIFARRWYS